jgi:hypothetical protein
MPDKAKYTIGGNELCKTFVTSTVLMKRRRLNNLRIVFCNVTLEIKKRFGRTDYLYLQSR